MEPLKLSNSELRTFKRCRRQWYLGYFLKWQTQPANRAATGAAELGTRIHTALEAHYGHGLNPLDALRVLYDLAYQDLPTFRDELIKERSYAMTMVEGFLDWSTEEGIDVDMKIVDVERVVELEQETDLGPVVLRGKLDQLIERYSDGAILFRDWKTVGTLSRADGLILDEQMRFYTMLLTLSNPDIRVDGGLYTMLLRSKRTARAAGPFYAQHEVAYNRYDVESMLLRSLAVAEEILAVINKLEAGKDHRRVVFPSPGDHCRWSCPFEKMCPMMDDGSRWEALLAAHFIQGDPYAYYERDDIDKVVQTLSGTGRSDYESGTVVQTEGND